MASDLATVTAPDFLDEWRDRATLRRLSRQTLRMSGLLERRPELRGVAAWSEGVVESALWSA